MRPSRMGRAPLWLLGLTAASLTSLAGLPTIRGAEEPSRTIKDGFESTRPAWKQELTDATVVIENHERSDRAAHDGRTSEHFRFTAGIGSSFYYSYPLPKIPVTSALRAGLFVRATRQGTQLFARVVLPGDTDPETGQPSFLLVPGAIYDDVERWQRLEIADLPSSLERQARVLRATSRRRVSLEGAFIEQLVVNLFSGEGETDVFIDELTVGPVPAALVEAREAAPTAEAPVDSTKAEGVEKALAPTRLDRNRLKRRGKDGLYRDWVFTAIHAPGADIASLGKAGFDVLRDDLDSDSKRAKDAVNRGFLLAPTIPRSADGQLADAGSVFKAASTYPYRDSVAFWDLGEGIGRASTVRARDEEIDRVRKITGKLRTLPDGVSKLVTGVVSDDLERFAKGGRTIDLIGIDPPSWGTTVSPIDTMAYLRHRRDLTALVNPGANYWAELPATVPPEVVAAVWGRDMPPTWGNPAVQPEQLRLYSYAALSAGYRGLAFNGDAELTRGGGNGRMNLLEMSFLNAEIKMCESVLANGSGPIALYNAFEPDPPVLAPVGSQVGQLATPKPEMGPIPGIKVAAIPTQDRKGVLLLMADYAGSSQFQPPQAARNNFRLTVSVPEGAMAYEISPGKFKAIEESERYVGGRRLTIPEFDSTMLLLVTTDFAMAQRVEAVVNSIRPTAAAMAIEQAEIKLAWVTEIASMLQAQGHVLILDKERLRREANGGAIPTDQNDLLNKAATNIKAARENLEREDYSNAWSEARRASRSLRILMRGLWQNAFDDMQKANTHPDDLANDNAIQLGKAKKKTPLQIVPAVASAPLLTFNTLPQHYVWVDMMKNARFGRNLVPSGSFDAPDDLKSKGWVDQSYQFEGITATIKSSEKPEKERGDWLVFRVYPTDPKMIDSLPPSLDFPAAAIRSPAVKVKAGEFFRISVDVLRRLQAPPGPGGVIVRSSIGGKTLQYSTTEPMGSFTKIILYNRAPEDGDLSVTLGLAGYGGVFFDNFRIERAEDPKAPPSDVAARTRPAAATPTARREPADRRPNR